MGVVLMIGCTVQKPVVEEAVNAALLEPGLTLVDSLPARQWQEVFTDAPLQALIAEALDSNADLRSVQLNVMQAEAQLRSAGLSYLPSVVFAPAGTLTSTQANNQPTNQTFSYELPLTMSWELPLGGELGARREMNQYLWMGTQEQLAYARINLIANIANTYYTLVMLDEQLRLSEEGVVLQQQTLEVIRALKEVGRMNELAVNQAEAALQETVASVSDLRLHRDKTERALNLLLSRPPQSIHRSSYDVSSPIVFDTVVSLEALAHRPDVRSTEYALRAAFSNSKVARSQFYPTLRIAATGSWTNNVGEIVNPAQLLLNLVGGLTQPLFQQGKIKADFEIARAQQEQAQLAFCQALLQAGSEVADALAECRTAEEKLQARQRQVEASRMAAENSRELMRYSSSVSYLEVLTAQSSMLNAQLQATADWLQARQGSINLYKALCR